MMVRVVEMLWCCVLGFFSLGLGRKDGDGGCENSEYDGSKCNGEKGIDHAENLKSLGIFKMLVAPLRKSLDAGSQCCARCRSALTSNQPHRFAPNPLDYTDAGDYGPPHLYHPN